MTQEELALLKQLEAEEAQMQQSQGMTQEEMALLQQLEAEELQLQDANKSNIPGAIEAGIGSFGDVATLGYLPQIQALTAKGVEAIGSVLPESEEDKKLREMGINVIDESRPYVEERDLARKRLEEQAQKYPTASTVGGIAGGLSTAIATGGAGSIAKGAGALGKIAQAAKTGATYGALQNPGDIEGEISPLQLEERAKGAASGAATGAVLAGGLQVAGKGGKLIKESGKKLKSWAELKALKSSGAMLKDFRKQFGNKKANQLGQSILDNNVVQVGDDVATIAQRAEVAKIEAGKKIGSIYKEADDILSSIKNPTTGQQRLLDKTELNMEKFADNYKKQLAKRTSKLFGKEQITNRLNKELDELSKNKVVSLKRLQEIRQSIDDQINFSKANQELPGIQKELLKMRNKLQDFAKARVEAASKIGNKSGLKSDLIKANKDFSNLSEVHRMASDKAAREASNAAMGLRERISGGAGAVIGGMMGGVTGAVAGGVIGSLTTKAARQYGTPVVARSAYKAAQMLLRNPDKLGRFADPLIKAGEANPEAFVKAVQLMRKDPEFRRKLK